MSTKSLFASKTFWMNLLIALVPVVAPMAQTWIAAHPETAAGIVALLNILNRVFGTSTAVSLTGR